MGEENDKDVMYASEQIRKAIGVNNWDGFDLVAKYLMDHDEISQCMVLYSFRQCR